MAEGAPLLREYGFKKPIEGSNPSLSAIYKTTRLLAGFFVSDEIAGIRTLECRKAALGSITGHDSPGRRRRRRRPQGEGHGWPESIPLVA